MTGGPGDAQARLALIRLAHGVEPGDARIGRLVAGHGPLGALDRLLHADGSIASRALAARLAAAPEDPDTRAAAVGARVITCLDREWPTQLEDLGPAAPHALWVTGAADLRLLALRSIAIVGARACTTYGSELAHTWAADLAGDGWCVLSGGAFGIDAAAHRGLTHREGRSGLHGRVR